MKNSLRIEPPEMSVKLKVCGMKHRANIEALMTDVAPDFIGLIAYAKSPRYMKESLSGTAFIGEPKKVGVFVNADLHEVREMISSHELDLIQLHGKESPEYCEQFRETEVQVIKVFSVSEHLPTEEMKPYVDVVDFFLLDTKTPDYGGSGRKFDWEILKDYTFDKPFFLSGGISPEDVAMIKHLDIPQLYALDINSKFEVEPGLKDIEKIKEFKKQLMD